VRRPSSPEGAQRRERSGKRVCAGCGRSGWWQRSKRNRSPPARHQPSRDATNITSGRGGRQARLESSGHPRAPKASRPDPLRDAYLNARCAPERSAISGRSATVLSASGVWWHRQPRKCRAGAVGVTGQGSRGGRFDMPLEGADRCVEVVFGERPNDRVSEPA
jgi:hypothetical protein